MNFPAKLYTDINDEVLIYASSINKWKHFTVPIEKWDMSGKPEHNKKISGESKIVWESVDIDEWGNGTFSLFSSIVVEGAIFEFFFN